MTSVGKYTSKLSKAKPKSISLKTTVPKGVVKALELEEGDKIDWDIRVEGDKKFVIVTRAK